MNIDISDKDHLCPEDEDRFFAEANRLYVLEQEYYELGHHTNVYDAGVIGAARLLLEHAFICHRHIQRIDAARANARLLAAINAATPPCGRNG